MPSHTSAANAAVDKRAKNEVFGEVRGLADAIVDEVELRGGEVRFEPAQEGLEERCSVPLGEGVGGHGEDNRGPQQRRPPYAQPCGDQQLRAPRLHLSHMRTGSRVAPCLSLRHPPHRRSYPASFYPS